MRPAPKGTVVVIVAGREATTLAPGTLFLYQNGSWSAVGQLSGSVPAAPNEREVISVAVTAGAYGGVRIGPDEQPVQIKVTEGLVEPILLGIDQEGHLIPGAAYAGNDEVNLGLGELSGKFVAMPTFNLFDQKGLAFNNVVTAGNAVVIAAFHTTCHETCPLYTALMGQLARQHLSHVLLVEVTTDPADTQSVLGAYAKSIGATWTFATASAEALTAFWKPFGVELSSGDSHTSTLALVDSHGFIRLVYRGVPDVGHDIGPELVTALNAAGLQQLASGGEGWGTPEVLQALFTIAGPVRPPQASGGVAPNFTLDRTDRTRADLSASGPRVINFWGIYCPPCRAEMPMLQRVVGASKATLILVNEGDSSENARSFLESIGVHQPSWLDSDLKAGHAYGVIALPTTVFVRADGTIAARQIGQLDERVLAAQLSNLAGQ
jgi:cytochrome oxidase Cu insertion factor (SCO1/SenC/PrrC family)